MQILVATLCGAVHQQQRAAAYAALLPSLVRAVIRVVEEVLRRVKPILAFSAPKWRKIF